MLLPLLCAGAEYRMTPLQMLMEKLILQFDEDTQRSFQDEDGSVRSVSEWDGLIIVNGNAKRIRWAKRGFSGTFAFDLIPQTITTIVISTNDFTGEVKQLPAKLEFLSIEENRFFGTIDWALLPSTLSFCDIRANVITGELDMLAVPSTIKYLYMRDNDLKIVNRDAPGAWKADGDVASHFTSLKLSKAATPGVPKPVRPPVRPVSESVPFVARTRLDMDAAPDQATKPESTSRGVTYPSLQSSGLDEMEDLVLPEAQGSPAQEDEEISEKQKPSWLGRIFKLLLLGACVAAYFVLASNGMVPFA